ncbi:Aminoglycoside phosphotransferase [Niveomyces insectorum RCEF 264]|uniref:Aminoglycoside phosphotransferase n=1 Tax=Niveomyces insectorum RCEF 264 TaxID=1081102 RepID=A0A167U4D5_9HYPO|nr:Aminoglycoside phosphotransferase [Niveomyces insectorum RCEF 264]
MASSTSASVKTEHNTLIRNVLNEHFGREVLNITPCAGSSNNSTVYILVLGPARDDTAATGVQNTPRRPGTEPLPGDATKAVIRLTNPGSNLNDAVTVQSQVAVAVLLRAALKPTRPDEPSLVPRVYGWQPAADGGGQQQPLGWIVEECMPGVQLDDTAFDALPDAAKNGIVDQVAGLFGRIQQYQLPASIVGYGGLDFAATDGRIVTGPTPIYGATKACATYHELYTEYLQTQLAFMDKVDIVQGWRDDPTLRTRIDDFVAHGFQSVLARAAEPHPRQTLVHGDFDLHNVLVDPQTHRITALPDFQFGHVAAAADEYFYSFARLGALLPPRRLLHGFTTPAGGTPTTGNEDDDTAAAAFNLAQAQRTDEAFARIDLLSQLFWFVQNLSPGLFFLPRVRAKLGPERAAAIKTSTAESLSATLREWGF